MEEVNAFFEEKVRDFLSDKENVELKSINVEKDNLSVIKGKNNKSLNNVVINAEIVIDDEDLDDRQAYADELSRDLMYSIWDYGYFIMKVKEMYTAVYNLNDIKIHDQNATFTSTNESVYQIQNEKEYEAQTLAYKFNNSEIVLQKFGIIEDNELYIEYYVEDGYFSSLDYDIEKITAELTDKNDKIKKDLTSEEKFNFYIENSNIQKLTLSFYSGNFDDEYLIFNYDL